MFITIRTISNIIKDLKVRLLELKDKYGDQDEKYPELISNREKVLVIKTFY